MDISYDETKTLKTISGPRVGLFNIGSGRILEKIPGSWSGTGWVGVMKYTIGYFQISFLLSGISQYSWVFLGLSVYFFGGSEPDIKVLLLHLWRVF